MTKQQISDKELEDSLAQSVRRLDEEARRDSLFQGFDTDGTSQTIQELTEKIARLEAQLRIKQSELAETTRKLKLTENNREEYKSKYFQFKGIFQRQTKTFYLYQGLSEASKDALGGIFKGTSFENFLACGVQPGNIDAVWEFARSVAIAGNMADLEILEKIIAYFVSLYNGTNDSDVLAFQPVRAGDLFDVDMHIRTPDSKAAGYISRIILTGLTNAFTGEIIKKAVVEIK